MKIDLIGINARYSHSCLALFYLRNELRRRVPQAETRISQYTINDPYYLLLQRIAGSEADYLFFSALIWNSDLIERLIEDLLQVNQEFRFVVGGPQAAVIGMNFSGCRRLTIFRGDIEAAGADFFDGLLREELKDSYQASFLKSADRQLRYPYDDEDFNLHLQNRAVYYESSRGCPFFCTYCLSSAETGVFHKDIDQVLGELDDILKHRPETVRFVDRTFNDNTARALAVWRFLRDRDGETLFHFEIAPDRFSEEMFSLLETVRPGLFQFEIGIQSTNPETLKSIRRPIESGAAGEVIRRLRRMENIHLHADLILGLPFETPDTLRKSINDMFAMQPHYIQMGLLKLLPQTEIRRQADSWQYRYGSRPPYPVFANRWLDERTMRSFYWLGECLEHCYNNRYFPSLWHYLVSQNEDMATFFFSLAQRFFNQGYFWKAATQKTLCRLLLEEIGDRKDFELIRELICYDWLRCGHRYLPEMLCYRQPPLEEIRRSLYNTLPQKVEGLYQVRERKTFIKTGVFHYFSAAAAAQVGLQAATEQVLVCFLNEREQNVHRLNKACLMQFTD